MLARPCPYFGPVTSCDHHIWRDQKHPAARAKIPADGKLSSKRWRKKGLGPVNSYRSLRCSMRIRRHFTVEDRSPYEGIAFRTASSEIRNPDGSIVFAQNDIEVPESWSQGACDALAQKYFRKAGVPKDLAPVTEEGVPQ